MIADVAVRQSKVQGLGVFALRRFSPGESVLIINDSYVVDESHPIPPEELIHCDFLENGKTVWMQIPERFINHSCRPNVFVRTVNGLRHVKALLPIHAGEEIAYDYCINSSGDTVWTCHCGAARCRHQIHSDFFHLPLDLQLEYLPLLDDWFRRERREDVLKLERK